MNLDPSTLINIEEFLEKEKSFIQECEEFLKKSEIYNTNETKIIKYE